MKQLICFVMVLFLAISCQNAITKKTTKVPTPPKKYAVQFVENSSLEDILSKAKQENKPVFVDFYTTWCSPCKWMIQDVYEDNSFYAQYFNKKFVNFKVNCESFDGIEIAQQFKIKSFPTMLFLDKHGNILKRNEGMVAGTTLIRMGDDAIKQMQSKTQ